MKAGLVGPVGPGPVRHLRLARLLLRVPLRSRVAQVRPVHVAVELAVLEQVGEAHVRAQPRAGIRNGVLEGGIPPVGRGERVQARVDAPVGGVGEELDVIAVAHLRQLAHRARGVDQEVDVGRSALGAEEALVTRGVLAAQHVLNERGGELAARGGVLGAVAQVGLREGNARRTEHHKGGAQGTDVGSPGAMHGSFSLVNRAPLWVRGASGICKLRPPPSPP
jgi:hypothetical protein